MPLPQWLARFNRRFTNPAALKRGTWPVLAHVGRSSGTEYRTPVGAEEIDGGYLFFINYGTATDWVRNIVTAGSAVLEIDDRRVQLTDPRVIPAEEGFALLGEDTVKPPSWVGLEQCLVTRVAHADTHPPHI